MMARQWIRIAVLAAGFAAPAVAGESTTMTDLAPLAGCWRSGGEDREYVEQWMKPAGGTMLGMSRTVAGGKTLAYEFLEIRVEGDGIYYVARPSGQGEAAFKLISNNPRMFVFENPTHDFPQRVIYRLESKDKLVATVEGTVEGKLRQEQFPMTRVPCN